jgi:molybdopterin-guanine dinucleotide biosynthesis protein A
MKYVQEGRVSPRDFLATHDVNLLFPSSADILLNINDPEGYKTFKQKEQ